MHGMTTRPAVLRSGRDTLHPRVFHNILEALLVYYIYHPPIIIIIYIIIINVELGPGDQSPSSRFDAPAAHDDDDARVAACAYYAYDDD